MRRQGRGRRQPTRSVYASAFAAVRQIATDGIMFTADRYTVDGVSGKVASWVDWSDPTHTIAQAVSGNQCVIPVADSTIAGRLTAAVTSANAYYSNRASSAWIPYHGGSGAGLTAFHIFKPTVSGAGQYLADSTGGGSGAGIGMGAGTTGNTLLRFRNATIATISSNAAGLTHSAWNASRFDLTVSSLAWVNRVNGTTAASGTATDVCSSGNPNTTMRWFSSFTGNWWGSIFLPRVATAADVAALTRLAASLGLAGA